MNNFYTANIEMYKYVHDQYENSDQYADHILTQAKINKNSVRTDANDFLLVTTLLWERHLLNDLPLYKNLFDSFKKKKIKTILILDSHQKDKDVSGLSTEIHYVNYFLWRTYDKVVRQNKSRINTAWNRDSKKFLILNGKPGRKNRIRLLWKLKPHLHHAIWSLHVHGGTKHECRSMIPELSDGEFEAFVKEYNNNPDQAKILFQTNSLHYGGIPYDEKMFSDSLFRIITETDFVVRPDVSPWLTEKTFLTILNNLPFIMAGDNNSLLKLNKMGFRTFEKYLAIPDYDQILDEEKKLDAIVENTTHWISSMINKDQIEEDVRHNHQKLIELANENLKNLQNVCVKYGIDPTRVEDICTTFDIMGNE
jgi:hypothetical protein